MSKASNLLNIILLILQCALTVDHYPFNNKGVYKHSCDLEAIDKNKSSSPMIDQGSSFFESAEDQRERERERWAFINVNKLLMRQLETEKQDCNMPVKGKDLFQWRANITVVYTTSSSGEDKKTQCFSKFSQVFCLYGKLPASSFIYQVCSMLPR